MGDARRRGSYDDRKAEAIAAGRTTDRPDPKQMLRRVFGGSRRAKSGHFKDAQGRVYSVVGGQVRRVR